MYLMEYSTICRRSFAEITEKKSRFLAQAIPVESEDAAREALEEIRKTYWDARHHVFAYRVGIQTVTERFSDDGEPARTAGLPILDVIKGANVQNTLIVVTRYFGGIKLGAGGLIRAYAGSVAQAVREIGLVEIKEQVVLGITLSYSQYQEFANFLKDHQLAEQDPMFTDQVMTTIFEDKENTSSITAALVEFYNGKVIIEDQGIREVEVPLFSVEK